MISQTFFYCVKIFLFLFAKFIFNLFSASQRENSGNKRKIGPKIVKRGEKLISFFISPLFSMLSFNKTCRRTNFLRFCTYYFFKIILCLGVIVNNFGFFIFTFFCLRLFLLYFHCFFLFHFQNSFLSLFFFLQWRNTAFCVWYYVF